MAEIYNFSQKFHRRYKSIEAFNSGYSGIRNTQIDQSAISRKFRRFYEIILFVENLEKNYRSFFERKLINKNVIIECVIN